MSIDNIYDYSNGSLNGYEDYLGVTHINPQYYFGQEDCVIEGAQRIESMGSKSIKLYLSPNYRDYYAHNIDWAQYNTPAELAQSPSFSTVFDMDFNTFFLGTFIFGEQQYATYWRDELTEEQLQEEYQSLYDLTYWLCTEYQGSDKTFILQNWEGDWSTMEIPSEATDPSQETLDRMIRWTNIRQDAVNDAREAAGVSGVRVYHALEVNLVRKAINGGVCVTNNVIPYTYCDYYSYSAYDTEMDPALFAQSIDYLRQKAHENQIPGRSRIFVGEFGLPQNEFGTTKVLKTVQDVVEICREKEVDYVIYWQLYDNEVYDFSIPASEQTDANCRGYWMIKPSNTKTIAWNYFFNLINGYDDPEYTPEPPSNYDYLEITLGVINQSRGLTQPNATDGMSDATEIDGKTCHMSPGDVENNFYYMYFKADDDYITPNDNHIAIEITYYDRGTTTLALEYWNGAGQLLNKSIQRTNTEQWLTHTFLLTDAVFDNQFHGGFADFRLNDFGSSAYVHYVKVYKYTPDDANLTYTANNEGDEEDGIRSVVLGDVPGGAYNRGTEIGQDYISAPAGTHLRFAIDETLIASPELSIAVTVEYFDGASGGGFVLYYTDGSEAIVKASEVVLFEGTNTWKTYTFHLPDANFSRLWYDLADFSVYSDGVEVPVHSIRVTGESHRTSASILLRANPIEEGIQLRQFAFDGSVTPGEFDGRECLGTDGESNQTGDDANYIYFDVDDTIVPPTQQELWIEITYFDNVAAPFELQYNSTESDDPPLYLGLAKPYEIQRQGTGQWVTVTVHITDANFANKLQGGLADMRISDVGEQLWLSRVVVYTVDPT